MRDDSPPLPQAESRVIDLFQAAPHQGHFRGGLHHQQSPVHQGVVRPPRQYRDAASMGACRCSGRHPRQFPAASRGKNRPIRAGYQESIPMAGIRHLDGLPYLGELRRSLRKAVRASKAGS